MRGISIVPERADSTYPFPDDVPHISLVSAPTGGVIESVSTRVGLMKDHNVLKPRVAHPVRVISIQEDDCEIRPCESES
jgi:hypothetical protein